MPDKRPQCCETRIGRLEKRLERERRARQEAEETAERGLRELYTSSRRLALLSDVASHANRSDSIEGAATSALTAIRDLTGWPFGSLHLLARDANTFGPAVRVSTTDDDLSSLASFARQADLKLRASDGSVEPGNALMMAHEEEVERLPLAWRLMVRHAGLRSLIVVPIAVRSDVSAVLIFLAAQDLDLSSDQIRFLTQVADQVARVSERNALNARLVHDALHDPLTGLANRQLFLDRLDRAIVERRTRGSAYSVIFFDLDRFKDVNDQFGHAVGDALLIEVSRLFVSTVADLAKVSDPILDCTVARLGGDEYCILVQGEAADDAAIGRVLAAQCVDRLSGSLTVLGQTVWIGASAGVASSHLSYSAADAVVKDADAAMYAAKTDGRGCVKLFDAAIRTGRTNRQALVVELANAVEDGFRGFEIHFQPIVALQQGQLRGFEALMRWSDRTGASVPPDEFIPCAESHGLIVKLGNWVLDGALQAIAVINSSRPRGDGLSISINVSPLQLNDGFAATVAACLAKHVVPAGLVNLEITEGITLETFPRALQTVAALRDLGLRFSIDDFGAGHATFSSLRNFPFNTLKIDRSFIEALTDDRSSLDVIAAVVRLARNMGASIVAEGVETEAQLSLLRSTGCDDVQGYLFSPPVPFDGAVEIASKTGWDELAVIDLVA